MRQLEALPAWPARHFSFQQAHEGWLAECREQLPRIHEAMTLQQSSVPFAIEIANVGTRQAQGLVVDLKVEHDSLGMHDRSHGARAAALARRDEKAAQLPSPPTSVCELDGGFHDVGAAREISESADAVTVQGSPRGLRKGYRLEYDRWRHGDLYTRTLVGETVAVGAAEGSLIVTVHADNLSWPAVATVPVVITPLPTPGVESVRQRVASIAEEYQALRRQTET